MKDFDKIESNNYLKAKKQVDELKGFYVHLAIYLAVNLFITTMKVSSDLESGDTFYEAITDFGSFAVWLFWGIGIFFHAWGVFGRNVFFGKDWEERKLQQYMEEDKTEFTNKYE